MGKATAYTSTGTKSAQSVALPPEVFEEEIKNHQLLQEAYRAYLANGRRHNAKTLTRGLVRGGGKKPHPQKGTGRARAGSIRSPIWVGGGVTFGPSGKENYSIRMPLKAKRKAIRQALTLKAADGAVKIIEDIKLKDGKTKEAAALLQKLEANRRTVITVANKTPELVRATANLVDTELVAAKYLNVFRIMNADNLIITRAALDEIKAWLGTVKPAKNEDLPPKPSRISASKSKSPKGSYAS